MNAKGISAIIIVFTCTGCYTQLYTRGYAERTAQGHSGFDRYPQNQTDTIAETDSTTSTDSNNIAGSGNFRTRTADTLYQPPPVIVNNYYQDRSYYRGYPIDDWADPYISLSFYSSRYRDYYHPYWHNDPWYRSRHSHYHSSHGHNYHGSYPPPSSGSGASSYKSDKRIFNIYPGNPTLKKGRRSESGPAAEPAPSEASASPAPAPKTSEESRPESNASSREESSTRTKETSGTQNHPPVTKGKRR